MGELSLSLSKTCNLLLLVVSTHSAIVEEAVLPVDRKEKKKLLTNSPVQQIVYRQTIISLLLPQPLRWSSFFLPIFSNCKTSEKKTHRATMIETRPLLRENLCKKSTEHHHPRFCSLLCASNAQK